MKRVVVAMFLAVVSLSVVSARGTAAASPVELTFEERVAAQRAIEEVYWRHRIWPADNARPKPPLESVMPESAIRAKVEDYLRKSNALERRWRRPITGAELQAELDRMGRSSRDPRVLRELFDALGDDAFLAAETLGRQILVERRIRVSIAGEGMHAADRSEISFDAWWRQARVGYPIELRPAASRYTLPDLSSTACVDGTWAQTLTDVPDRRQLHTAVWTGSEMIVWGGNSSGYGLNTGSRYDPATDTWSPTSNGANALSSRLNHTAVWTGTEMIVWGGEHTDEATGDTVWPADGARYDPASDTWTAVSAGANAPVGRELHTAVWTGTEMIVWGGWSGTPAPAPGARYRPDSDSWSPISGVNAPNRLFHHSAVWTGTEMVVWGGTPGGPGGRYDPVANQWTPMSTVNEPSARAFQTAVWTGQEMIVWGGYDFATYNATNTGSRYDPATDVWTPTSAATAARYEHTAVWTGTKMMVSGGAGGGYRAAVYDPADDTWAATSESSLAGRSYHTAVWTGSEMIVWGGRFGGDDLNTGGRYDPAADTWAATSISASVPAARAAHTAVWTGTEMIVWGGQPREYPAAPYLNSGGRYTPATDSWVPTSLTTGVPEPRGEHSAVWTGSEMIVWGGGTFDDATQTGHDADTGGRYDPMSDTWTPTGTGANTPPPMRRHAAVWTGTEMIVWGPGSSTAGGRYDPTADSWRAMAEGPVMMGYDPHLPSVWTGTEMIVWRGDDATGGRYDPVADSWSDVATSPAMPPLLYAFAMTWTGSEMFVWGGCCETDQGGRYDPATETWTSTSTGSGVPSPRQYPVAIWTGSEVIVWGGYTSQLYLHSMNGGGRYDPVTDSWSPIPLVGPGVPAPRYHHTAVWTGTEMIVWGGSPGTTTGGRYCACPNGALFYRDADGDGFGDPGVSAPSCDGTPPAGYVANYTDCRDGDASANPGATEVCDGVDNDCNGLVDDGPSGVDADGDAILGACDDCPYVFDPSQSDFDHDGEGNACDLDDGMIFTWRDDATSLSWQPEQGPASWNVYFGDLDVLKASGVYTQAPGSSPLADRRCGVPSTTTDDPAIPDSGKASFALVTGVTAGAEGSLGASSIGARSNTDPCP